MTAHSTSMWRTASLVAPMLVVLAACGGKAGPGSEATPTTTGVRTTVTAPVPTSTIAPTTTRATATIATVAATRDCTTVAFAPDSEDAASSVTATGLPCAEAEAFVRIAGRRTSAGGPPDLETEGYRCVQVRVVKEPLPRAFYECTNGPKKVGFVRS